MINTVEKTIPNCLRGTTQKAYENIKDLIQKIFSLLKIQSKEEDLKVEFEKSFVDFACKLDDEGYNKESNMFMSICIMYYDLMDRPKVLMEHESFFTDLFQAFDELLFVRMNDTQDYEKHLEEFIAYKGRMQQYYYTKVAIPSPHYNEEVLNEIACHLIG